MTSEQAVLNSLLHKRCRQWKISRHAVEDNVRWCLAWNYTQATGYMSSLAPGVGLAALQKFLIDFKIFKWKCPLQNDKGLALSIGSKIKTNPGLWCHIFVKTVPSLTSGGISLPNDSNWRIYDNKFTSHGFLTCGYLIGPLTHILRFSLSKNGRSQQEASVDSSQET